MGKYSTIEEQKKVCLPLIEEERKAYIKAEHGRLQGVMNTAYWDSEAGEYVIFHSLPDLNPALDEVGDPYDLTMEEIALLPSLKKRIERVQTYSYLKLYPVFPEERERLTLLGQMKTKLDLGKLCTDEEVEALISGHQRFIHYKLDDAVEVIM
ncbi:hypothetical protein NE619_09960 [Anaerovorax odorimutans]|uniref:Uncharacterized protein n=1 Tax=Anaerovorax odorimutans TaxID=109327 RepID=A0ABT1RPF5_9FIRM|nr:hypothetical protein [Anaerovorax odorimutans]MCQ4637050.1 hypothetical protein [Anaerovorax odorimutans]